MERVRQRVTASRSGLENWLANTDGVTIIRGWGSFAGRGDQGFEIKVGAETYAAPHVYINTGTRAFVPPITGLSEVRHLDNVSLLKLTECPDHLIILGGSYIGLEMGQIFRRLGAKVTIVEGGPRVASREDEDVSEAIEDIFRAEGIDIITGQTVAAAFDDGDRVGLEFDGGSRISGSHMLIATGRLPNSDKLNLGAVNLQTDGRGFIDTDAQLQTAVPGIWALGDINKRGAFTHTSYHDHEIVLAHRAGFDGPLHQWENADQRPQTYAMFSDPPLGRVGIGLVEAQKLVADGRQILIATHMMADVSRAKEEGETAGLIRVIVDGETEQILGATILGIGGDEIISVLSNFMATGASYRVLRQALPVHPTVAEFLPTVLAKLKPLSDQ
jgi:pyruvate/2-oxoglutarate dehydrogenase complex dihydrolipoamide dehydrogenase (E3) component